MSAPIFLDDNVRAKRSGGVPLKRLGTAEDVVQAVLFLASDASGYIHGHELVVDGGVIQSVLAHLPRS
jgi:NAD(P)-dependent dehydrogenase (short-subunit alcohol dehydrogenase family)